jgi:hypothetical protein
VKSASAASAVETTPAAAVTSAAMLRKGRFRGTSERECRANHEDTFQKGGTCHDLASNSQLPDRKGGWNVLSRILHHLILSERLRLQLLTSASSSA